MLKKAPEPILPQPTTPKGRATLARILASGRETFGQAGYVSMRMSDLAERAGLSMGALYRYFDNKDDVFLAIIHDIHNELYAASRPGEPHIFRDHPRKAILESNRGYLTHYRNHRKVMRAFIEATMVDPRYNDMWWYMRERHIIRVATALERDHGITEVNRMPARISLEALASMTEQSAYVWYAHPDAAADMLPVADAACIVSEIWYCTLFSKMT
ncbi:helix-turn-helix domain-containing protein [Castellaniella sp. MT123]|uniref:TetR/AcrR family transcriptional regulator n=1 Tax=Castellaniella sp. MT123 TaxID=3140381 RepID=UPI0031F37EA0